MLVNLGCDAVLDMQGTWPSYHGLVNVSAVLWSNSIFNWQYDLHCSKQGSWLVMSPPNSVGSWGRS